MKRSVTQVTCLLGMKIGSFVIQKYIERSLLIYNRKFDIRCWVFVNYTGDFYFFKEGYLRTSSTAYDINDFSNIFMHLTNNAVQIHSKHYGEFEDGNQLSFDDFNQYISKINPNADFYSVILPQIKLLAKKAVYSV